MEHNCDAADDQSNGQLKMSTRGQCSSALASMLDCTRSLVEERVRVNGREMVRAMACRRTHRATTITLPQDTAFYPCFRRATPWGGSLNVRFNFPDFIVHFLKMKQKMPFVVIDTDYSHFGCTMHDATAMRNVWDGPMLLRDFYLSDYQIDEARALGADGLIFRSGLWQDANTPSLLEICCRHGLHAFVQVSCMEDLAVLNGKEKLVFVSPIQIGKRVRTSSQVEVDAIVEAVGRDRCVVIDPPYSALDTYDLTSRSAPMGIAYPDQLWSGDHSLKLFELFFQQNRDFFIGLNGEENNDREKEIEREHDEPWVVHVGLYGNQAIIAPYASRAEATRALTSLRNTWSRSRSAGAHEHNRMVNEHVLSGALHGGIYAVDLSLVTSAACYPAAYFKREDPS